MTDAANEQLLASLNVGPAEEAVIVTDAEGAVRYGTRAIGKARAKRSAEPRIRWRSGTGPWVTYVPAGTLLSGDLLPGSTRVEVRTPVAPERVLVAGGAYMALVREHVQQHEALVIFRDDRDQIVPWPVARELKREPVTDATVACPACGELDWDAVEIRSPSTARRYRQRGLVCGTCGHQWGGWTDTGRRRRGAKENDERIDSSDLHDDPNGEAKIVGLAQFQVYTLPPELVSNRSVSEWGTKDSTLTSVAISHVVRVDGRSVEIRVSSAAASEHVRSDDLSRAAGALAGQLFTDLIELGRDGDLFEISPEARSLRLEELRREAHERADRAMRGQVELAVDGKTAPFALVREESGSWCAAATVGDVSVTVGSDAFEPAAVQLVTIKDPNAYSRTR
jgi:hypothetical protein